MNTQKYILRLSGEITVKSDPVRKKITKLLRENIAKILASLEYEFILTSSWDLLELQISGKFEKKLLEKRLQNIFGVSYILSVNEYDFLEKEEILPLIEKYFFEKLGGKKFFVRVKRVGKHSFSSQDLERLIGGHILKNVSGTSVSLKEAEVLVSLEIKDQKVFVIEKRLEGAGGYPTGFSGKVLSLISGGFDSTVSSYMAMKRGLEVDFLFFDLGFPPQTLGVQQVSYFLWKEYEKSYKAHFIKVDFSFLVELLLEKTTPKFRSVLLKRYMLKTTHFLNAYLQKKYGLKDVYQALVKGDSIAQVSSQTLTNLTQIDTATSLLVLRPLIMFDKQEIIDVSRKIGTYDFAHNMPEYCGVVSQNPSTKATKEEIETEEAKIDALFFDQIENKIAVMQMSNILDDEKNIDYVGEIVSHIDEGIVIDIREREKIQKNLLVFSGEKIEIPFYTINSEFAKLDQTKKYYLYCEKGTLSKLHALYLQEKGFQNVGVVRFGAK